MGFPSSLSSLKRLPCLDGWRCLSILLVLISHSTRTAGYPETMNRWVRWIPDGEFGVEFFFVISGFLITFLLIKEKGKTGTISLRGFYQRRILRIIPAYACFLMVFAGLCLASRLVIPLSSWAALATYTVNYISTPWIGAHIWSLSVEEQFYLIWPILFWWFVAKKGTGKFAVGLLILPILAAPVCRVIGYVSHFRFPFDGHSFLCRGDSVAIGCLLALSLDRWGETLGQIFQRRIGLLSALALLAIAIPQMLSRCFLLGPLNIPFGATMTGCGIALLIGVSIFSPRSRLFHWLEWRPIIAIGVMSYSIYLWQQIFCTNPKDFGLDHAPWFLSFPYWLVPVFVVAFLSYEFIEKPFLRLKSRLT